MEPTFWRLNLLKRQNAFLNKQWEWPGVFWQFLKDRRTD